MALLVYVHTDDDDEKLRLHVFCNGKCQCILTVLLSGDLWAFSIPNWCLGLWSVNTTRQTDSGVISADRLPLLHLLNSQTVSVFDLFNRSPTMKTH